MVSLSFKRSKFGLMNHLRDYYTSHDRLKSNDEWKMKLQAEIKLFDAKNLNECPWNQAANGHYAQRFLTPFIQNGVATYIENVLTEMRVLAMDDLILPITINGGEYDNSYVCSPYSYFISYARQSLDVLHSSWLCYLMNSFLAGLGKIFRHFEINKVVIVNNWLFSTNLYPKLSSEQVMKIAQFLHQFFPKHAIVFRSVDSYLNPICYQTLKQIGYEYIATRQVFFIDPHASNLFDSRIFKSDLKLLKNSGYKIIDGDQLTAGEIPRLLELYRDLSIHKYSDLNPKFNEEFLRLVLSKKIMNFKVLKKGECIDGVVGYVEINGKMYCPFFGYDRDLPKEAALFRLLSTVLMLEAYHRRCLFHQSAGASIFKKIRRAQSCIEYTAVYYKHLPLQRQIPWLLVKNLYNSIGKIYMKRY
jgi:hypothetical protein